MHLNLPPDGSPEYWRAVRQLVMRAKVDVDRLWGRQEQYASQAVLESLGGLLGGKGEPPQQVNFPAVGSGNAMYQEYSLSIPNRCECFEILPVNFQVRVNGTWGTPPTNVGPLSDGDVLFVPGSWSFASSTTSPYCGSARQYRGASSLRKVGQTTGIVGYARVYSNCSIAVSLGSGGSAAVYSACNFDCFSLPVTLSLANSPSSSPPTSLTLIGYA